MSRNLGAQAWKAASVMPLLWAFGPRAVAQCHDSTHSADEGWREWQDVEILGDTMYVGAHWEISDGGSEGVVRVFVHDGETWLPAGEISSPNPSSQEFGYDVEPLGPDLHVLVSDPSDAGGVVWELAFDGSEWVALNELRPPDPDYFTRFGHAISADGQDLIIGAPGEIRPNGTGAVRCYERNGQGWRSKGDFYGEAGHEVAQLGYAVHIGGTIAIAGGATGSIAYTYRKTSNWSRRAVLTSDEPESAVAFGRSVRVVGEAVAVADPETGGMGMAYLFSAQSSGPTGPQAKVGPWLRAENFGVDIDAIGDRLIVQDRYGGTSNQGVTYLFRKWSDSVWLPDFAIPAPDGAFAFGNVTADDHWVAIAGSPAAGDSGVEVISVRRRCVCPADFNEDGLINPGDVLAFLNAWSARDRSADINQDGRLDTQDVVRFLQLWNQTKSCDW